MTAESRYLVLLCWFSFGKITDLCKDPPLIVKQFPDSVDLQGRDHLMRINSSELVNLITISRSWCGGLARHAPE